MAAFCGNCGGGMGAGAMSCGSCGFNMCGGCGTMSPPGMMTCGSCGWSFGRRRRQETLTDEVSQYVAAKRTVESLQEHGQGDSAEEEAAEAGMRTAKTKLIVSAIFGVVVLIIFIIVLSKMHSAASSPGGLAHFTPGGLHALAPRSVPTWW